MPTRSLRSSLALALTLAACGGKGQDTTADATSTTQDGSSGLGGSTTSGGSATQSTADPSATTTPPPTSGPTSGDNTTNATFPTSDGSSGAVATTGEPVCVPDPVPPPACDGGKPKPFVPRFASPPVTHSRRPATGPGKLIDDPDAVFASSGGFIIEPDAGDTLQCDIFGDDCGPGEKCNAWANNGGGSWNATKCVPVVPNPDPIGAPCTAEGGGVSGIDSCVKGAMCWGIGDDNMGTCVEQCTCSIDNPICATPNTTCTISNNESLVLCLPGCDPLDANACAGGDVCISSGGLFQCVLDASGDAGGLGDACQFANACDPGFLCGANNGTCDGAGCCTPFCDLTAPVCPEGLECLAFFEEGQAPQCFEDVGVCFTP